MKIDMKKFNKRQNLYVQGNIKDCFLQNKYGKFVTVQQIEVYGNSDNYGIYNYGEHVGGFSVDRHNELFSIYKISNNMQIKYFGNIVFECAEKTSADKFCSLGKYLPKLALNFGFIPVAKMAFDSKYWKENEWDYSLFGRPNMYFCIKSDTPKKSSFESYDKCLPVFNDFERAKNYRDYSL